MSKTMSRSQLQGLLAVFVGGLNSEEISIEAAQSFLKAPREASRQLTDFVSKGLRTPLAVEKFPVWKTLWLGDVDLDFDPVTISKRNGFNIQQKAEYIIRSHTYQVTSKRGGLELSRISPRSLGFSGEGAKYYEIQTVAYRKGLSPCPPNVAPKLRKIFSEQEKDCQLFVGMEAVDDPDGRPLIFNLDSFHGDLDLDATHIRPEQCFGLEVEFVFLRRQIAA